jgi:precorrin-3B C17-methyltransferase
MTSSRSASGRIYLVGLGPGNLNMLTPLAREVVGRCEVVVGYKGYIDQISDLITSQQVIPMDLGRELDRANSTVDLAVSGKDVALVSSGDSGIYGMAGPLFTVLTDRSWDGLSPEVQVVPGVSALQSAAALLGSPLMQDFCAISLSDLLTPWETILRRITAAAEGDFVVALYNPRSRSRTNHLLEARRILLDYRHGDTPVGLVREAFREDQHVSITTLQSLEDCIENVDMFTTVLIGNSTTYIHSNHMVTPRGYEKKLSS